MVKCGSWYCKAARIGSMCHAATGISLEGLRLTSPCWSPACATSVWTPKWPSPSLLLQSVAQILQLSLIRLVLGSLVVGFRSYSRRRCFHAVSAAGSNCREEGPASPTVGAETQGVDSLQSGYHQESIWHGLSWQIPDLRTTGLANSSSVPQGINTESKLQLFVVFTLLCRKQVTRLNRK